jgi:hypothetical protein
MRYNPANQILNAVFFSVVLLLFGCGSTTESDSGGVDSAAPGAAAVATGHVHDSEVDHDHGIDAHGHGTEEHEHGPDCEHAVDGHGHDEDAHADEHDHEHAAHAADPATETHADEHDHEHAAHAADPATETRADEHDHEQAHLELDDVAADNLGILVHQVHPEVYYDQVKIPGTLAMDPDRQGVVSAPAMVRVVALDASPPAAVSAGERLALLELADPEVRNLQMRAVEVRGEHLAAVIDRDRSRNYLNALRGASGEVTQEVRRVSADLEVDEARVRSRRSALDALLASLKTAGLSAAQLVALEDSGHVATHIAVFAPELPGSPTLEIADRPVQLGQTIGAGGVLFSLVALDRLRVIGEAFESDMASVRRAAEEAFPVTLLFPAEDRVVTDLRIMAVEGALDGVNRVTHFFVELPNRVLAERVIGGQRYQDWEHRAGSRVQILVATQRVGRRYVIPSTALVRHGGNVWLFRKHGERYERVAVRIEAVAGRRAVLPLDCGLHPGDELVIRGALQLDLLLQDQLGGEAQADPHAGHSH